MSCKGWRSLRRRIALGRLLPVVRWEAMDEHFVWSPHLPFGGAWVRESVRTSMRPPRCVSRVPNSFDRIPNAESQISDSISVRGAHLWTTGSRRQADGALWGDQSAESAVIVDSLAWYFAECTSRVRWCCFHRAHTQRTVALHLISYCNFAFVCWYLEPAGTSPLTSAFSFILKLVTILKLDFFQQVSLNITQFRSCNLVLFSATYSIKTWFIFIARNASYLN